MLKCYFKAKNVMQQKGRCCASGEGCGNTYYMATERWDQCKQVRFGCAELLGAWLQRWPEQCTCWLQAGNLLGWVEVT